MSTKRREKGRSDAPAAADTSLAASTDDAVRAMLLLMPRVVGRAKRTPLPKQLEGMQLAPRHLSLLSYLLFDGDMSVAELADRLAIAPTTVSLMVSDLSRHGVVDRTRDPADRRRVIVGITSEPVLRAAIETWLARGARAWRSAFENLTARERALFVRTIETYEQHASGAAD